MLKFQKMESFPIAVQFSNDEDCCESNLLRVLSRTKNTFKIKRQVFCGIKLFILRV